MKDRRSLVNGLVDNAVERSVEEQFVFSGGPKGGEMSHRPPATTPDPPLPNPPSGNVLTRVPLTTRLRSDFSAALKRASLERQLNGVRPNTVQDILEDALEPWLRSNGYVD